MSMRASTAALLAGVIIWAWIYNMLLDPYFIRRPIMFQLGAAVPLVAIMLIPSGVVALMTRAISKSGVTAMKTWWVLSLLVIAFFAVGAALVRWPLIP